MTSMVSRSEPVTITSPMTSMTGSDSGRSGAAALSSGDAHASSTPADSAIAAPTPVIP